MFSRHEWDGAPQQDQRFGPRYIARSALIRKILGSEKPANVLDIGCGSGNITRHVARFSGHVHAIDVSPEAIGVARANLSGLNNISFESLDVFGVGADAREKLHGKYDVIVLSEVLEHLDDDEGTLATVQGLLGPGGKLLLTVPGDPHQWSIDDDLSGHKRRYTKPELKRKLADAGFVVEQIVNWGFPFTRMLVGVERKLMSTEGGGDTGRGWRSRVMRLLLRPASVVFNISARIEPLLSFVDAGVGYVVVARIPATASFKATSSVVTPAA